MGRRKSGKPAGRTSSFQGEKRQWLQSFESDFRSRPRGAFYSDVTKAFLTRYGYDLAFEENVDGDIDNWKPADRRAGLQGEELEAEIEHQEEVYEKLRLKLSNWFRHCYTGKRLHRGAINGILHAMQRLGDGVARPRRKANVAIYSAKYYTSRIKEGFDKEWAKAKATLAPSMRVSLCQDYVKKSWERETKEFQEAFIKEADEEHAAALKKYREQRCDAPHTREDYHEALETLDDVGIPLADALAERLGMHIVILAVGPVGKQNGEVRLRSVFSDTSGYQTSKTWGEYDHQGFTAMEKSITRYGRAIFSKDECRERAIDVERQTRDTSPTPSTSNPAPPSTTTSTTTATAGATTTTATAGATTTAARSGANLSEPPPAPDLDNLISMDDSAVPRKEGWSADLEEAYAYFSSKKWGARWDELLALIPDFEKAWDWNQEPLPSYNRPAEIAQWMKEHREAGDYQLGPGFAARILRWWREIGPWYRNELWGGGFNFIGPPMRETLSRVSWRESGSPCTFNDWKFLRRGGKNGMLLAVRVVTWWGQEIVNKGEGERLGGGLAALEADEEFQSFLDELIWAYKEMMGENPEPTEEDLEDAEMIRVKWAKKGKKAAQKGANKRKRAHETAVEEPPAKKPTAAVRPQPRRITRRSAAAAADGEAPGSPSPTHEGDSGGKGNDAPPIQQNPSIPAEEMPAPPVTEEVVPRASAEAYRPPETNAPPPESTPPPPATEDCATARPMTNEPPAPSTAINMPPAPSTVSAAAPLAHDEDVPMDPPPPAQDDNDPFFDPFADDPTAGMSEEEKRAVLKEIEMDREADEGENEGEDGLDED